MLEPDEKQAVLSSGSPVTTELKLSLTLRFLCGACHDHAADYPVSEYRVSRSHIDERPSARAYPPRCHRQSSRPSFFSGAHYLDIVDMHGVGAKGIRQRRRKV